MYRTHSIPPKGVGRNWVEWQIREQNSKLTLNSRVNVAIVAQLSQTKAAHASSRLGKEEEMAYTIAIVQEETVTLF